MKRFRKTFLICLVVIAVLAFVLTGCSHKIGNELLSNGNFETINQDNNRLDNWEFVYIDKDGKADKTKNFKTEKTATGSNEQQLYGDRYISITTSDYATAYLKTSIRLYAGQKYRLKFDYNVSGTITSQSSNTTAVKGYFGFLEDKNFTPFNVSSSNGWQQGHEIYFTPRQSAKYTFVAGIGRQDLGGATGTIEFDNISIQAVKDLPLGVEAVKLTPGSAVTDNEVGGVVYTVLLCLFGVALVVGAYYAIRKLQTNKKYTDNEPLFDEVAVSENNKQEDNTSDDSKDAKIVKKKKTAKEWFEPSNLKKVFTSPMAVFIYTLVSAFIVRFILVLTVFGMGDTITDYAEIALTIAQDGPSKLYGIHNTYLPTGWLYLLGFFGVIGNAAEFTANSIGLSMLIRIPNIIADLAVCYMIYKMLASNYNFKYSSVIAGIYALLPAMFTQSVVWGMNISVSMAFLVAMINFMVEKKHVYVPIMYTLGLMFNNFMLIALPVVIGYEIYYCIKDRKAILPIVIASLASLVVFYCLSIPFATAYFGKESKNAGVLLVFAKMLEGIKANNLISNSSFNFYAIFGLGQSASNIAMTIIIIMIAILFIIFGVYLYAKTRNRLDFILLTAMSFILWAVFGVGSRVEYTLIGLVLLLLYAGLKMEKRVFKVFGILSVLNFINSAVILTKSGAINFAFLDGTGLHNFYALNALYIIGSLITVATVVYMIWVMYDIMFNGVEKEIPPLPESLVEEFKDNCNRNIGKITKLFQGKK